ncbi:phage tail family protein [Bacillus fungorum]|uniref:phage tail family protein n=1 Tax=Bacillus fungorum TaxID=2039284 RepID=UPI003F57AEB1
MFPRSIHNFKIIRKDGKPYDCYELGLFVNSFKDGGIVLDHDPIDIPSRDGLLDRETRRKERKMAVEITMEAVDHYDFDLLKDEVYRLFDSKESFYIVRDVQPGKRYEVKCDSPFSIARTAYELGEFTISLVAYRPFAESIGTTMDDFTFDSNLWQIGQGLIAEDVKYSHNTTSFRIYNAGDVTIDPKSMPLKIYFTGGSNSLQIKNKTTGDLWSYASNTMLGDWILLDGVKVTRSGFGSVFGKTNYGLITLKPGWNDFELTGPKGEWSIDFDFRFYYL